METVSNRKTLLFICLSILSLVSSFFFAKNLPVDPAWIACILCGLPILYEAAVGLITEFDIKADVLVSIALIASVIIGELFAAGEIAVIMTIGAYLEERTVDKAQASIKKLIDLSPATARVIVSEIEKTVEIDKLQKGDILRVIAGETIPVDGEITAGQSSIDQSLLTGESVPIDKYVGDEVFSGTINQFGTFEMIAKKTNQDSSLQRMIDLVESADAQHSPIVKTADKWATWIVFLSLSTAILVGLFTQDIIRAVTILVVFCPCALVLATPTAIVAGIGNATRHGILIKSGDSLEKLATVKTMAFDKTGTITHGKPAVVDCCSFTPEYNSAEIIALAAAVEKHSEHPLGKAIGRQAQAELVKCWQLTDTLVIPGEGITAKCKSVLYAVGNQRLMKKCEVMLEQQKQAEWASLGYTVIWIAQDCNLLGAIALADTIRQNAPTVIQALADQEIESLMLTGDDQTVAEQIGKEVHVTQIYANCLPENKLSLIQKLQAQGKELAMLGDGINDAPSLKIADVGIAMGGIGSDIAIDAADIVLTKDSIEELPFLVSLARKIVQTIRINIFLAMSLNLVAVVLAAMGIMGPIAGALVHNLGSVTVIIHSALLLNYSKKESQQLLQPNLNPKSMH